MRWWRAHLPSDVPSACSADEVHSTAIDVHRARVRFPPKLRHLRVVLNLSCTSGMVGQYPAAPLIGKLIDCYGPWLTSLISSVLFASTFSLSAWIYASTPQDIDHPSSLSFKVLMVCFGLAGLAQASSWVHPLSPAPHLLIPLSASSHHCLPPQRISRVI